MNEHVDVMCHVRESFSGLRMDTPVENVFARSRQDRRRRLAGLTAAAAGTAGAAAAVTLVLGGAAPAHSGNPTRPTPGLATLAAFSVTSGPGGSTTLILHKGPQYAPLSPSAVRQALAQRGIPALVTIGTFCRSAAGSPAGSGQVVQYSTLADGSDEIVINGSAMPSGAELSIGYFGNAVRMLVIDDAAVSCSSTSDQQAVRVLPSGTKVGG